MGSSFSNQRNLLFITPGGTYFGGHVAFEMAQQLQAQGCTVALLALFDPGPPSYVAPTQHRNAFEKIGYYVRRTVYHFKHGQLFHMLMNNTTNSPKIAPPSFKVTAYLLSEWLTPFMCWKMVELSNMGITMT
jgi:hypothetical protein